MPLEVCGPDDRFVTHADGHTTWHSFSFGEHYDPHNVGFGALLAHNDELLPSGTGYADHPHSQVEILTWVLSGALRHRDSTGRETVVRPGQLQRLSAGSGIVHSERSAAEADTRFIQSWVRPDDPDRPPAYAVTQVVAGTNALAALASGDGGPGAPLGTRGASLHAGLLDAGTTVALPDAPRLHVFVASGAAALDGQDVPAGGVVRLVHEGGHQVAATRPGTHLLIWALP
jgi:quercetin 2,3-dioxygenase